MNEPASPKRPSDESVPPHELEALVAATAGWQPWRKLFHACNALGIAAAMLLLPRGVAVGGLVTVTLLLVVGDLARLRSAKANALFFRAFSRLASPREAKGIASSTWYAIGALVVLVAFPLPVAVSSVLVLGLADPAASYVGRHFGTRPFLGGTVEGSLVFLTTAALVLGLRHPLPVALAAALAATLAERRSWPLDDNLAVPVVCGAVLGLGALLGIA